MAHVSQSLDVLLDYLRTQQTLGVSHVYLDEPTRVTMRKLFRLGLEKGDAPVPASPVAVAAPAPVASTAADIADLEISDEPAPPEPVVVKELELVSDGSAAQQIEALKAQAECWEPAKTLRSLRETMVFSVGNPDADLMLVGEAPGYHEEHQRQPFVGPAGQKLDGILKAMGVSREDVYISNIVKFRPSAPGQTTNNRKPNGQEVAACLPFMRAEVGIVKPRCIVALGASAAEGLLGLAGVVGRMRGKWYSFEGVPVRVTYHPAYLLHGAAGLKDKRMIWEDMLSVMEKLKLPISDKQQNFFLPKP